MSASNISINGQRLLADLYRLLAEWGDHFFHIADYRSYVDMQGQVSELFKQRNAWAEKAVLNVARMGYFSSDRSIREYAQKIWDLVPVPIEMPHG